jgi:HPt (histidine-containing phosphotransfer) domain-containing protein
MEDNSYIDFEEGKKFLANDHLLFLERFYDIDLTASINSLKSGFSNRDWIELKRSAHSLKGTSSYIGALTCRKLSENLQLACTETPVNEEKIKYCTKILLEHLGGLFEFLKDYFNGTEKKSFLKKESEQKVEVCLSDELKDEIRSEIPDVVIKKLVPPISRINVIEVTYAYEEDEIDAYEEMNKQWKCSII